MALRNETIEEIRKRADIVSLISSYIPVTKKGRNYFCVCPFHSDTNPSMSISQEKQIYKCFSCGAGGNVFTFVQEYEKVSFIESVKIVANFVGIDISSEIEDTEKKISSGEKRLFELINEANEFYKYNLETEEGLKGKEYLEKRELDEVTRNKFQIGFSLNDGTKTIQYLMKKGFSIDEIISSGIALETNGKLTDRFKGRLIFPLANLDGKVVGFSGRKIDNADIAKYVNSPETNIFIKGNCLYNYYIAKQEAKKLGYIYIVEGFMDVIALSKIGINNVVAIMGTSFTENQIKAIKRLNVKVIMALDNDDAGQDATFKIINELEKQHISISVVTKDKNGKDLDELLKIGKDKVISYLNNQLSPFDFKISYQFSKINTENYEEKKEFVKRIAGYYMTSNSDDLDKDYYISKLVSLTGFSYNAIKSLLGDKKEEKKVFKRTNPLIVKKPDRYEWAEKNILSQMLYDTKAIRYYIDNLNFLYNDKYRIIAKYVINYYYDNNRISENDLLSRIDDPVLRSIVTDLIYENDLQKSFDVQYFDVIRLEKPLSSEIGRLQTQIEITDNEDEKLRLYNLKNEKLNELQKLKDKFLKGGN